jgi:DNA-damage-inducible protein D
MSDELTLFHFEDDRESFEDFGKDNGVRYWMASDLMRLLGYTDFSTFKNKALNKAVNACTTLNIPIGDNFMPFQEIVDGKPLENFKLTRFACYLVAMNGDVRKPQVAKAQVYFAVIAESFRNYIETVENVERLVVRDEISEREKSLSSAAINSGVVNYAFFHNAGYRGMYNMNLKRLKTHKGVGAGKTLLDYMGKEELAANLFRITQTEARIKAENIKGQRGLEQTAEHVGKRVRKTMIDISGTKPEDLPITEDIKQVKSKLKATSKRFLKMDKTKKKSDSVIEEK